MKQTYIIYNIVNLTNNKIYIGCSKSENRFYHHRRDLKLNKHCNTYLQNSWNKYGEESFKFVIVECLFSEADMYDREIELINSTENIYNIAAGGSGGNTRARFTPEQKKVYSTNRSIAMKKYYSSGGKVPNLFHNIDDSRRNELIKKWSDCKKGLKNANAKYPQRILQKDLDNNLIKVWNNIYEIREDKYFNAKYVTHCCNKKEGYHTHKGFKWSWEK